MPRRSELTGVVVPDVDDRSLERNVEDPTSRALDRASRITPDIDSRGLSRRLRRTFESAVPGGRMMGRIAGRMFGGGGGGGGASSGGGGAGGGGSRLDVQRNVILERIHDELQKSGFSEARRGRGSSAGGFLGGVLGGGAVAGGTILGALGIRRLMSGGRNVATGAGSMAGRAVGGAAMIPALIGAQAEKMGLTDILPDEDDRIQQDEIQQASLLPDPEAIQSTIDAIENVDWPDLPEMPSIPELGSADWPSMPEPPDLRSLDWPEMPDPPDLSSLSWPSLPEAPDWLTGDGGGGGDVFSGTVGAIERQFGIDIPGQGPVLGPTGAATPGARANNAAGGADLDLGTLDVSLSIEQVGGDIEQAVRDAIDDRALRRAIEDVVADILSGGFP